MSVNSNFTNQYVCEALVFLALAYTHNDRMYVFVSMLLSRKKSFVLDFAFIRTLKGI